MLTRYLKNILFHHFVIHQICYRHRIRNLLAFCLKKKVNMRWRFNLSVEEHKKLTPWHKKMPLGRKTVIPGHKKVTLGAQKGAPGWQVWFPVCGPYDLAVAEYQSHDRANWSFEAQEDHKTWHDQRLLAVGPCAGGAASHCLYYLGGNLCME